MKTVTLISMLLLTACGSAGGGSSGSAAVASGTGGGVSSPTLHTYVLTVDAQSPTFTYAPQILDAQGNGPNPGPETATSGTAKVYSLTADSATIAITGGDLGQNSNNGAYYAAVTVVKDGVTVASVNVGVNITYSWSY